MILNNNYKTIEIDITTYLPRDRTNKYRMDDTDREYRTSNQNRFICSICLNKKASQEDTRNYECCKKKTKSCPICQKHCVIDGNKNAHTTKNDHRSKGDGEKKKSSQTSDNKVLNGKNIQTSQPDVTKGLTLLNEVLTVFQSKKQDSKKDITCKTVIVKDASIETEKTKHKLTISRTFLYSLGENDEIHKNGKFSIINSQPEMGLKSQFSIDLKHKSSSIPQMKLEELKNSLKEKTKSKDAIEEVNRMFATVRKHELEETLDDSNRPMIRNGPRVLPVVKTNTIYQGYQSCKHDIQECCKCKANYQMSSGDSMRGCCQKQERYEDCHTCFYYKHRCVEKCDCCNINKDCKHTVDLRDK
ncbi:uncharacterized protein LOC112057555 [Bicyclus anynana]|uniref:Uncharacterized protein LOC112057555 n=1 Tax=Bicyclus anynana TaxID=110368 RepID=A0A6J1P7R2_BICAN|nr:uncharacterized protein LOC112057555 [Bicyclus anynana]